MKYNLVIGKTSIVLYSFYLITQQLILLYAHEPIRFYLFSRKLTCLLTQ